MKILLIWGDDDYAALNFEEEMGIEKAKEKLSCGEDIEGENFYGKVYEFGDVDEKFIDFIKSEIMDYDMSKHKNFYILE